MGFGQRAKVWAAQVRAPFLLLSVVLVMIGGAVAYRDGAFNWLLFGLTMIGVTLSHAAVNLFNEYSDYKTGIDEKTNRTPFSGGSGSLQKGLTRPGAVLAAAWGASIAALAIGLYLASVSGWALMIFVALGGVAAVFYTSHISHWVLGEVAAGSCLGTFVVLGCYFVQTGTVTSEVVWLSIPPGILTALLLFLNEFPDAEADKSGGRRHLVIALGYRKAALLYAAALAAGYSILVLGFLFGWFPATILIALLTLPLAVKASLGALRYEKSRENFIPAMGSNVAVVLGTDLLIAIAYFIP